MSTQQNPEFEKLRQLLALKRHERPPQGYFDGFLSEFHRRQRIEPICKVAWWAQLAEFFRAEPLLVARYALGAAVVVLLTVNVFLLWNQPSHTPVSVATATTQQPFTPMPPPSQFAMQDEKPLLVASNAPSHFVLDRVPNVSPASYEPSGEF